MKLMIASDIHGSTLYCRELMRAFEREEPDRLLLLGDLLYHGPRNGLPVEYDPKEVITMLNGIRDRLLCVRGNCDAEIDQLVLEFPIMAEYCILYCGGHMVFATHGHHFHKDALPPLQAGDILLHGHTHVPAWEKLGAGSTQDGADPEEAYVWYMNPGSVSLPKGGSLHGYMVMESDGEDAGSRTVISWKELDGNKYHEIIL